MNKKTGKHLMFLGIFLIILFFYCEIIGVHGFVPGLCIGAGIFITLDGYEFYVGTITKKQ